MFAWMTVMSFDLCWTFMRARMPRRGSATLKYLLYSLVAWGWGFLLTTTVLLADQLLEEGAPGVPRPGVGHSKCFLEDRAQGLYLHAPVLLLMVINGMFFLVTTSTLYR